MGECHIYHYMITYLTKTIATTNDAVIKGSDLQSACEIVFV